MTCDELSQGYDTFALGFEEQPEANEIREHLHSECPNCVPGIRNSLKLMTKLGGLVEPVNPPARLRRRIVAAVKPELLEPGKRTLTGWSAVWGATSILFLAVAILLGVQARHLSQLRFEETERLQTALGLLTSPDSQEVTFGTTRNQPPRGRVVVNRRRKGVVLLASNLPRVAPGKAFQLWLIPRGASPISAGVFQATPDGSAVVTRYSEIPENLGTVAVTVEDEGGAAAPTSTPIIAADTR